MEFWELNFIDKKEMWGLEPAYSATLIRDYFVEKEIKNILIPGIGYGRNAHIFAQAGMKVTGIEISQTAIDMATKHYGDAMTIYHGSVTDMPYDTHQYEGIFCYALIHLLDEHERAKLIRDCYHQLAPSGTMVFVAITKKAHTYGTGTYISKDRYEVFSGVRMFFYDRDSVQQEFGNYGIYDCKEVQENYPFYIITCQKASDDEEGK